MDKSGQFLPAKVPGTVHTDLFENGLIPHPFVGNNELKLQWISDERWQYVLEFELSKEQLKNQNIPWLKWQEAPDHFLKENTLYGLKSVSLINFERL